MILRVSPQYPLLAALLGLLVLVPEAPGQDAPKQDAVKQDTKVELRKEALSKALQKHRKITALSSKSRRR